MNENSVNCSASEETQTARVEIPVAKDTTLNATINASTKTFAVGGCTNIGNTKVWTSTTLIDPPRTTTTVIQFFTSPASNPQVGVQAIFNGTDPSYLGAHVRYNLK